MLALVGASAAGPRLQSDDLHAQSAATVWARDFGSADLSYMALNEQGQVVAQRWENADRPVSVGSLVKPFIAMAYARDHDAFPEYRCTGKTTCWLPRGHGKLGMSNAIALSCNSYFHQLAAHSPGIAGTLQKQFAITLALDGHSGSMAPLALAYAYLQLAAHNNDKAAGAVLSGMRLSASRGTGKAAGAVLPTSALAKTGTAPCTHRKKAPGDGFAVVMSPADHPRMVLLVRLHGRPGAAAAGVAGRMMAAVEGHGTAQ